MSRILVAYGTTEGQTARIAEFIAEAIRAHGHEADVVDLKMSPSPDPSAFDAVIVGGSIHMGDHDKNVIAFVEQHRSALQNRPAAFFSVSLAAHGDAEEAEGYVKVFEKKTGWHPLKVGIFAGALLYRQYNFIKRRIMKHIAQGKPGGLDTDVSRDYIYTEWDGVRRFVEDFIVEDLASQG